MNCLRLTSTRYSGPIKLTAGLVCSVGLDVGGLISSDRKYLLSKDGFLLYPRSGSILLDSGGDNLADSGGELLIGK